MNVGESYECSGFQKAKFIFKILMPTLLFVSIILYNKMKTITCFNIKTVWVKYIVLWVKQFVLFIKNCKQLSGVEVMIIESF